MGEETLTDLRSRRDRIIAMATAAGSMHEPQRRYAVKGLVHERLRQPIDCIAGRVLAAEFPCTIEDIFEAAYDDRAGTAYWDAWWAPSGAISELKRLSMLIDLGALHGARSELEYDATRRTLMAAADGLLNRSAIETLEHLHTSPDTSRFAAAGLLRVSGRSVERGADRQPSDRTGAPGRPSAMHLVEAELRRRHAAGEMHGTLRSEAEHLSRWLRAMHPTLRPATPKTICNRISSTFRSLSAGRPKI